MTNQNRPTVVIILSKAKNPYACHISRGNRDASLLAGAQHDKPKPPQGCHSEQSEESLRLPHQ